MRELALNANFLENQANRRLWEKVLDGFKLISGKNWESRADYQHFWSLVHKLYKMAYGEKTTLPEAFVAPLGFMFAGHAGRVRKGIRERPYFHHILMVVYLTWLLDLPRHIQLAAINHDDVEDLPKNLSVSEEWVKAQLLNIIGEQALGVVIHLSNAPNVGGKHAGQMAKIGQIPADEGALKLLDRLCNLWDMRRDRPKDFTPDRILQECEYALQLAAAMPVAARDEVLAVLTFCITQLLKENGLKA